MTKSLKLKVNVLV